MRLRLRLAYVLLAATLACGQVKLHATEGGLSASTRALHFPVTYRGYPTQAGLKVTNTSPARIQVALASASPFQSPTTLELAGGESKALTFTFDPTRVGTFAAPVTLTSGSTRIDVVLDGEAREPTTCPAAPCHHARFNPADGNCITEPDADGSACTSADACLTNASCRGGVCVGTTVSCDDHNACTADACSATGGCVHIDQTATCPAPSAPCKVAACDPSSGCGQADAPDGTVCGSVDCATAHLCFAGSCRAVTPPDGFECSPASPCQAHSTCQGGSCVGGAVTEMVPEWSVPVLGSWAEELTSNARGELFWVEYRGGLPDGGAWDDLVSVTSQGIPRFRVTTGGWMAMPVNDLIVFSENGYVSAYRQSDGTVAWRTAEATFDPSPGANGGPFATRGLAISTHGLVAAAWKGVRYNWRVTLTDPSSGRMVAATDLPLSFSPPAPVLLADPAAEIRISESVDPSESLLIDGRGNVTSQGLPLMVMTSTVTGGLEWSPSSLTFALRARSDGGLITNLWPSPDAGDQPGNHPGVAPAVGDDIAFVSFINPAAYGTYGSVTGADPRSGQLLFEALLGERTIDAQALTTRRSLVFDTRSPDGGHELDELDATGRLMSSCVLPVGPRALQPPFEEALLIHGRWVRAAHVSDGGMAIEAYAVPGVSPAPQ